MVRRRTLVTGGAGQVMRDVRDATYSGAVVTKSRRGDGNGFAQLSASWRETLIEAISAL